jgi:hypothetical protein
MREERPEIYTQEMRTAAETLATTPQPAAASSETLAMRKTTPAAASTTSGARSRYSVYLLYLVQKHK